MKLKIDETKSMKFKQIYIYIQIEINPINFFCKFRKLKN
jgi:hypothetical protein